MLLENTVTPWSTLVADKTRIAGFMGNKGIVHDATRSVVKRWAHRSWVCCATSYKGIDRRPLFRTDPFRYSELFFLDEATAYAAGHRPCNYCRRETLVLFKTIWCAVNRPGVPPNSVRMSEIDVQLHSERVVRGGSKVTYAAPIHTLPFGTMFEHDHSAYLIGKQTIYLWSASGYHPAKLASALEVHVLTPASVVASFSGGLIPQVHESVSNQIGHSLWQAFIHCWRPVMSISVEDLAAQALVLPAEDRAKLVERLIASFEPRSPSEAAWLALASRRRDDVRSGKVAMVPAGDAVARVRARIA